MPADGAGSCRPPASCCSPTVYRTSGRAGGSGCRRGRRPCPSLHDPFGTDSGQVDIGGHLQRVPVDRLALATSPRPPRVTLRGRLGVASASGYQAWAARSSSAPNPARSPQWYAGFALLLALCAGALSLLWTSRILTHAGPRRTDGAGGSGGEGLVACAGAGEDEEDGHPDGARVKPSGATERLMGRLRCDMDGPSDGGGPRWLIRRRTRFVTGRSGGTRGAAPVRGRRGQAGAGRGVWISSTGDRGSGELTDGPPRLDDRYLHSEHLLRSTGPERR